MKILFLLQDLPFPPSNGYKQKVYNLLDYVGRRHECDVLAFGTEAELAQAQPWLRGLPKVRVLAIHELRPVPFLRLRQWFQLATSFKPPAWLRHFSTAMVQSIEAALARTRYDVVHVDLQGLAQYCRVLQGSPCILSLNDAMSATLFDAAANRYAPLGSRVSWFLKAWHQLGVDKAIFSLADRVHFVGQYDLDWCTRRFGVANGVYIPLAVDPACLQVPPRNDEGEARRMLIIDKLWAPQHLNAVWEFLREHWAELHRRHPRAELTIIGGRGMPWTFHDYVASLSNVRLLEWVDRLEEALEQHEIALFPYSVAVGMKTRVLQCMAGGLAVVGTPNAFLGLPVEPGRDVCLVRDLEAMAAAADHLLRSGPVCAALGRNARAVIEANFTQQIIGTAWERLYETVSQQKI